MLDRIHKIAEIVAAFAIVGSLIFVGIQMQQNTEAVRINTSQAGVEMWQATSLTMATNPELAQAWTRETITPFQGESLQLRWFLNYVLKAAEHNYHQWLEGNLSDRDWMGIRNRLLLHFRVQNHYRNILRDNEVGNENFYSPEFITLMKTIMKEADAAGNWPTSTDD